MRRLVPTPCHELSPQDTILWSSSGIWTVYRVISTWCDGCCVASCDQEHPHACFLEKDQWVARVIPETVPSKSEILLEQVASLWSSSVLEMSLQGISMGAILPDGAKFHVSPLVSTRSITSGQVLVFVSPQRNWVAHRVVHASHTRQKQETIVTRGDARKAEDPPLTRNRVLGLVTQVFHGNQSWHPENPIQQARSFLVNQSHRWKQKLHQLWTQKNHNPRYGQRTEKEQEQKIDDSPIK